MRSIFLWRIILVLFITLILASLLVTGGYVYFSRDTYTEIRLSELIPEAEAMGYLYLEYLDSTISYDAFSRVLFKLFEASDTTGLVANAQGEYLVSTLAPEEFHESQTEDMLRTRILAALTGGASITDRNVHLADGSMAISVCQPITRSDGEIVGCILLIQRPTEIKRTTSRLNNNFFLVLIMVIPFTLILSSLSMRRMTEPLRKMGEVAIQMGRGDFDARANENEIGEIGLLARALNNLCDTLSQTIHTLRADKAQLRQILASLSEGVVATDSIGCITLYNPAVLQMFGAVRVHTRYDLTQDEGIWEVFDEVYRTGETKSMQYPLPNERMLWITFAPIVDDENERTGVVGLFKDMTEMENLERSRRDYVQNISHELRAPLTAIRGLLEPLADGMVTKEEDRQRYYKIMLREVLRLSRLITDMMQLSRLQSGTEYMEVVETDINEVLEDVHLSYSKEAAQRHINLVLDAPKLPHVVTDPDRVEQLLVILLSNAMRYTPEGGTITISAQVHERVNISVTDTGCGIPEEDIPYVFDRFYTVDKSRKEGNTGLGLSIAQQLIDKLGEKIIVQSKMGEGTCFCFTLKKYVSNAIALGPANEGWEEITPIVIDTDESSEDAYYEVLKEEKSAEKKQEEKQAADKKAADKKLAEKRLAEKRLAEKKLAEKKAAEKKAKPPEGKAKRVKRKKDE